MNKQYYILSHPEARRNAACACMSAPDGYVVEVKEKTRTLEQNALLHGQFTDISRQVEWYKQRFNLSVWKRLCTYSYLREVRESPLLIPALDGNGMDVIYEKTSHMGVKQMTGLIEWNYAFGSENNVIWTYR